MADSTHYETPGQFEMDGSFFNVNKDTLQKLKTSFIFKDDDILLNTYPKSGEYDHINETPSLPG